MNYTLIGSLTSPYVRKIRLLLYNIPHELRIVDYTKEDGNNYLKSVNPINKLPVLIDGEKTIYDSRVIYNYLSKKNNWRELSIAEENIVTMIDGAMDSSINLFVLARGGLDLENGNTYIKRQKERITAILDSLVPWVKTLDANNPDHWNFLTISLYSYLFWLNFRKLNDLNSYPEFKKFLEDFSNAPGVAETTILS